jgi:hypothetical protein
MIHLTFRKVFFPWNDFYAPPTIGYTVHNYQHPYDQPASDHSPYGQPENEPPSSSSPSSPSVDSTSARADVPDKSAGAPHNPVASQTPANGAETA